MQIVFLANTLELIIAHQLDGTVTQKVVFCMTEACRWMGEHGSEPRGIQSQHEPKSSKRRPSPQLVAMQWASVGVPIICVAEYFE